MSVRELFSAMYSMDFSKSHRFLSDHLTSGKLSEVAEQLRQESETNSEWPLMIRDHVFSFLGAFPVYTALNINSYDLLSSFGNSGTAEQALAEVVCASQSALEVGTDAFNGLALEIDDLATSQFSVLITGVLKRRMQELDSVQIPTSKMKVPGSARYRIRYELSGLWETVYGARVLTGIGLSPSEHIVGESKWTQLSKTLEQLGYHPEGTLCEVSEGEWNQLTASRRNQPGARSKELSMLELLRNSILKLSSQNNKTRLDALGDIGNLNTISCRRQVAVLAREGLSTAIRLLGDIGSQSDEQALESLLTSSSPGIRESAARSLSKIASREALGASTRPPQVRQEKSLVDNALDEYYRIASGEKRLARLDAMKAISFIDSQKAEQTLLLVYEHLDTPGRMELLSLAEEMRRAMAVLVVKRALDDQDEDVRTAALRAGASIWPEQEW